MSYVLREAAAGFRRAPLLTSLSSLMVGLALLVVGLFGLAAHNLRLALATIEQRVEVVAYVRQDARPADIDAATEALGALPGVETVTYVSKEEALERALRELPEITEVSSDLEVNPFPASLEIRFQAGSQTSEVVEAVASAAEDLECIEDVRYGQEWLQRLFFLRRVGAITSLTLGAAFAVVAMLIMGTAIRMAIYARREEIFVMRLVGARDAFIRRPFVLEGAATGLLGGLLALVLSWVSYQAIAHFLFQLDWIPARWVLGGLLASVVFGAVASTVSVRRHLQEV